MKQKKETLTNKAISDNKIGYQKVEVPKVKNIEASTSKVKEEPKKRRGTVVSISLASIDVNDGKGHRFTLPYQKVELGDVVEF